MYQQTENLMEFGDFIVQRVILKSGPFLRTNKESYAVWDNEKREYVLEDVSKKEAEDFAQKMGAAYAKTFFDDTEIIRSDSE